MAFQEALVTISVWSPAPFVATLQSSAGGTTTIHRCVVSGAANTFTILLTANATANAKVAWYLFG